MSVSASLFTTYLKCPAQALARLQGNFAPDTRASFTGMLAHSIFARHIKQGPIPADEFVLACRQEIGRVMNPKLASLSLRPSELLGVIAQVGALYERFKLVSTAGWREVEQNLEYDVGGGLTLRGRVDAVFDSPRGVRLVDWKTGGLGAVDSQLDFYALLWALVYSEMPVAVEAASIASGERYEREPNLVGMKDTARRVAELVFEMRAGLESESSVRRIGGPACEYCVLQHGCAEGQAVLKVLGKY